MHIIPAHKTFLPFLKICVRKAHVFFYGNDDDSNIKLCWTTFFFSRQNQEHCLKNNLNSHNLHSIVFDSYHVLINLGSKTFSPSSKDLMICGTSIRRCSENFMTASLVCVFLIRFDIDLCFTESLTNDARSTVR